MTRESDLKLAGAAATGDRADRERLVSHLHDRVRLTVGYLAANDRDAEDMVQSSLIEILKSVASFRGDSSLSSWANRITVRTSLRMMRRRRQAESVVQLHSEPPSNEAAGQPDAMQRRELRRRLTKILGRCRPKVRVAMVLRYVHGYSVAETAALLDAPIETVRDRLKRGRQRLRKSMCTDPVLAEWAEVQRR